MEQKIEIPKNINKKLGLHYFQDTLNYQESDLHKWLPRLNDLNISWLVLLSESDRAIPEYFLKGIINSGINPIIHFKQTPSQPLIINEIEPIIKAYAKWGVKQIIFYDKPNLKDSWEVTDWVKGNIVEEFLNLFTPVALLAINNGITPILPPLYPGGELWDTAFLEKTLQKINNNEVLKNHIQLSAYSWHWNHSLSWGNGGQKKWPKAKPYIDKETEDHRGFFIFEWYQEIAQKILGNKKSITLLNAGSAFDPDSSPQKIIDQEKHKNRLISITQLISGQNAYEDNNSIRINQDNLSCLSSCNIWLLAADNESAYSDYAFYTPNNNQDEIINAIRSWNTISKNQTNKVNKTFSQSKTIYNNMNAQVNKEANMAYENLPKGFYVEDGINVDFAKAKRLGYKFCIARAADCDQISDGSPYDPSNYVDLAFADNVQKAHDNGLLLGAYYRLGVVPNVHAVDWKTPGNGLQYQALAHALKNKTYQFIVISLPRNDNTDTNMCEMLKQFIGVIQTCMGRTTPPIVVATTPDVWQYGSKSIENFIGQPNFPHAVMVMNSMSKFLSPGNLPTSNNVMWSYDYSKEISLNNVPSLLVRFIGSLAGLLERFGTPINFDYIPEEPSVPEEPTPTDPPVTPTPTPTPSDPPSVVPTVDLIAAIDRLNATIREACRLD